LPLCLVVGVEVLRHPEDAKPMRRHRGSARLEILHDFREESVSLDSVSRDVCADLRIRIEQHRAKVLVNSSGVTPEGLTDEGARPIAHKLTREVELPALSLYVCIKVGP
jgi:hypothetical protein